MANAVAMAIVAALSALLLFGCTQNLGASGNDGGTASPPSSQKTGIGDADVSPTQAQDENGLLSQEGIPPAPPDSQQETAGTPVYGVTEDDLELSDGNSGLDSIELPSVGLPA